VDADPRINWRAPGLARLAVTADGRRGIDAPIATPEAVRALPEGVLVLLDHAGPCAANFMAERPIGARDVVEPLSGRRPRVLDDAGWADVTRAFVAAGHLARSGGHAFVLGLDDDGLLHDALRGCPERALAVVDAVLPKAVAMSVEDLAPGGLDATDGIALAEALASRGVIRFYLSAGSRALAPLRWRRKSGHGGVHAARAALASARWLVGRFNAELFALLPPASGSATIDGRDEAGLTDILIEDAAVEPADAS
jgi:hypothetical protein